MTGNDAISLACRLVGVVPESQIPKDELLRYLKQSFFDFVGFANSLAKVEISVSPDETEYELPNYVDEVKSVYFVNGKNRYLSTYVEPNEFYVAESTDSVVYSVMHRNGKIYLMAKTPIELSAVVISKIAQSINPEDELPIPERFHTAVAYGIVKFLLPYVSYDKDFGSFVSFAENYYREKRTEYRMYLNWDEHFAVVKPSDFLGD